MSRKSRKEKKSSRKSRREEKKQYKHEIKKAKKQAKQDRKQEIKDSRAEKTISRQEIKTAKGETRLSKRESSARKKKLANLKRESNIEQKELNKAVNRELKIERGGSEFASSLDSTLGHIVDFADTAAAQGIFGGIGKKVKTGSQGQMRPMGKIPSYNSAGINGDAPTVMDLGIEKEHLLIGAVALAVVIFIIKR